MASLLDTIRNNSAALATQKQGVTDQTQQTAALLRAKKGRAGVAPEVGQSNLAEQQTVATNNQAMQSQVALQAAIQDAATTQAARAEDQSASLQQADIAQSRRFNAIENKAKTEQLLSAFERDNQSLDLDKNRAGVNQFVQSLRLNNQQYLDNLNREGQRARLDDEMAFTEALQNQIFDNDKELQEKVFANQDIAAMSERDYQKQLATMGIDDAWNTFNSNMKSARERSKWEAIGSIASAGIGAANTAGKAASGGGAGAAAGSSSSDYTSLPDSYGTGGSAADYRNLKD